MTTLIDGRAQAARYHNAKPFPHVVLDDLFAPDRLREVVRELGSRSASEGEDFHGSRGKRGISCWDEFGLATRSLIEQLNAPSFVAQIEALTGIAGLVSDPLLLGGGIHQSSRDAFLKVHTDFSWHAQLRLHRRVNLLLYLNEGWRDEWGGHLELWQSDMSRCAARVSPSFNRVVIFSTSDESFHGHPEPLACPEDVQRNSIALYYYASEPACRFRSELTNYRERPGERFKSIKHLVHQLLIRSGLGSVAMRIRPRRWPWP